MIEIVRRQNLNQTLKRGNETLGQSMILTSGDVIQVGSIAGNVIRYASGVEIEAGATNETLTLMSDGDMTVTAGGAGTTFTTDVLAEQGYSLGVNLFIHATHDGNRDNDTARNTFIGQGSPTGCISGGSGDGEENTTLGFNAGTNLTQGKQNTFIGALSGDGITTTDRNTALGAFSYGASSNTGSSNTSIGYAAFTSSSSGTENSSLGSQSGINVTGGNGVLNIGACTGATSSGSYSHSAALGRNARYSDNNQFVTGSFTNGAKFINYYFGGGIENTSLDINGVSFRLTSVSSGVTDESAANYDYKFYAAAGTGTGLGSGFKWFVAPASTTGSTQNTFIEAMSIAQDGELQVSGIAYPMNDGSVNQMLITDGAGQLSFADSAIINNIVTAPNLTTDEDDFAPAGYATASIIRIDTNNNNNEIRGFPAPSAGVNRVIGWCNINGASADIRFVHNAGTSIAANRILLRDNANKSIKPNETAWFWYDHIDSRWRPYNRIG